jgi:predicted branched-subunit amino acid permease
MAPILKNRGIKRVLSAHVTIDESTGLAIRQNEINQMQRAFYLTGAGVFLFWNIFTLLGALGANAIGDPSAWGLDAAVPAAFLGLVWPRLTDRKLFLISILAMVFALALVPNVPAGVPVIATTLIAVIFGWKTTESK